MRPRDAVALALIVASFAVRPAASETTSEKVTAFEQRVEVAARAMEGSPRLGDLSLDKRRGIVRFVGGNVLFALLHEMGHAHITEMGLPVLGREEDAADSYAVVTMLKIGAVISDDVLIQAATGWFLSALRDEGKGIKLTFYDVHGLDRQRAYNIVCLMVGSNPDKFKELADKVGMPEDRQSSCGGDFSNASWSWATAMRPHLRTNSQPKTSITVTYGEGKGDLASFEASFRAVKLLELVADQASEEFVWRQPFALEMQSCDEPGASWNLATRRLILCYEMAAEFAKLYREFGEQVQLPNFWSASSSHR